MPAKKKDSWEDIGKNIGRKIEKECKDGKWTCKKPWQMKAEEHGGGFGRLLFAIGALLLLNQHGLLQGTPWYVWVLLIVGFMLMRL